MGPWAWSMIYNDTPKYTQRVINAGWRGAIGLAKTKWPSQYRIPGNADGGVYPPAGSTPTGTEPVRLTPPTSGNGRLMFVTQCTLTIVNTSGSTGKMSYGLGVSFVNGQNKPMYPYLGVAHALEVLDDSTRPDEFPAGSVRVVTMAARMDLLDNAFQSDEPIPGWPNWQMKLSTDGKRMYPAVTPMINNLGTVPLTVMDVFGFGYCVT